MNSREMNKYKNRVLSLIIAGLCILLINYMIPGIVRYGLRGLVAAGIGGTQVYRLGSLGVLQALLSAVQNIVSLACIWFTAVILGKMNVLKLSDRRLPADRRTVVGRIFLCGIWGFGASEAVIFCLSLLPETIQASYGTGMGTLAGSPFFYLFVFTVVYILLGAVTEEIVFRGFLYRLFRSSWKSGFCIFFISLLFAGIHGNTVQKGYAFFMGVLLCLIREIYGSVLYTIPFHVAFNLFGSGILFRERIMYAGIAAFFIFSVLFAADLISTHKPNFAEGRRQSGRAE